MTPLEAWLESIKDLYFEEDAGMTFDEQKQAIAVIEKLQETLKTIWGQSDALGHSNGSEYSAYARAINDVSDAALAIDPASLETSSNKEKK